MAAVRDAVEAIAREAGEYALERFRDRATLEIESKGALDLVTIVDRELEAMISERLHRLFPQDGILGEEGESISGASGRTWVLDPIDGTFNFMRGGPEWGISIGLHGAGGPIFGVINLPVLGQLFSGGVDEPALLNGRPLTSIGGFDARRASLSIGLVPEAPLLDTLGAVSFVLGKGGFALRASGSCVAGMMEVVRGETDVYLGLAEHSWDVMAALPIAQALGARCSLRWSRVSLADALLFAAGKPAAVARLQPLIDRSP